MAYVAIININYKSRELEKGGIKFLVNDGIGGIGYMLQKKGYKSKLNNQLW